MTHIDETEVRDMMTSAGFCEVFKLLMKCELNVEDLDDDLISLFVYWSRDMLSLDKVREAAKEVFSGEKVVSNQLTTLWFMVFRKL